MTMNNIITFIKDIESNFKGTIIDIETIGEPTKNPLYKAYNDSRQCENIKQVILGIISNTRLEIHCATNNEGIDELKMNTSKILGECKRPFYAFNADFESSVWFHHIGIVISFDGELQKMKFEKKSNAIKELNIPNYDDPFHDEGKLCMEAWGKTQFEKAIAHNRACLLKERDILVKRGFREPNIITFNR
jgi:hypothetical protein